MVTAKVKHMETPEEMNAGPAMMVSRASFGLACNYIIDEQNGNDPVVVRGRFPTDKYKPLDYTPVNSPNRFVGWFTTQTEPSVEADTSGRQIQSSEHVVFEIPYIYARWQAPAGISFDSEMHGGEMPEEEFRYYAGQPFGTLPIPTHPTLHFAGWFDEYGNRVTSETIVVDGIVLVAQYTTATYTVDLNDQWELSSTVANPDPSAYDGVYQSFSNYHQDDVDGINNVAFMRIRVIGYTDFRVYIRSFAESNYDYVLALQPDVSPSDVVWDDFDCGDTSLFMAHTRGNQQGETGIDSYTAVDYTLDGGEHDIWIAYRKDSSDDNNDDRGYVLIPKVQGGAA